MSNSIFPHRRRGVKRQEVETTMTIERNEREIDVTITATYCPGRPEVHYLRNGDPGYPAEPSEMEDMKATLPNGNEVTLTDKEAERATEALFETLSE